MKELPRTLSIQQENLRLRHNNDPPNLPSVHFMKPKQTTTFCNQNKASRFTCNTFLWLTVANIYKTYTQPQHPTRVSSIFGSLDAFDRFLLRSNGFAPQKKREEHLDFDWVDAAWPGEKNEELRNRKSKGGNKGCRSSL